MKKLIVLCIVLVAVVMGCRKELTGPGVYSFDFTVQPSQSRETISLPLDGIKVLAIIVNDEKAGFTQEKDSADINLKEPVSAGDKVVVYYRG